MPTVQVRYIVKDVDAAIAFYCQNFGFQEVMHPAPAFAMLSKGDLRLALSAPNPAGGGGQPMQDGTEQTSGGWNRFAVEVDDIEETVEKLKKTGAHFRNAIVTGVGGKQVLVDDPSGNPVELFQPILPEARFEKSHEKEDSARGNPVQQNYAKINGLQMYYEIHGSGEPLVLLHGGLETNETIGENLQALSKNHQVIAVELQGHGHTADIDRPMSFEYMADDVAALIEQLGLGKTALLGYSLGGGVALQTAIRHSDRVDKLVLVSTPCSSAGWYPEVRAGMQTITAEAGKSWVGSPLQQAYARVAPNPDDWSTLVGKLGDLLRQDYDWSEAVSRLTMPVLIVIGDADSVRTAHAVDFLQLLGGGQRDAGWDGSGKPQSRLAILPNTTHYDIISSPALAATVIQFLDENDTTG